jgi:hypothetical protein
MQVGKAAEELKSKTIGVLIVGRGEMVYTGDVFSE